MCYVAPISCVQMNKTATHDKVVEEIFGDSIHREVVGRSSKLLRFLSSMEGALTTEHLDLIWMSCVGKAEPELQVSLLRKYGLFSSESIRLLRAFPAGRSRDRVFLVLVNHECSLKLLVLVMTAMAVVVAGAVTTAIATDAARDDVDTLGWSRRSVYHRPPTFPLLIRSWTGMCARSSNTPDICLFIS